MSRLVRQATAHMAQLCASKYTHAEIIRMLDDVRDARDAMLGSREKRMQTPGQVSFELDPRAEPLRNAPRCFGANNMVQQPRQLEGPPANLKTVNNEPDEYQVTINRYVRVSLPMHTYTYSLIAYLCMS